MRKEYIDLNALDLDALTDEEISMLYGSRETNSRKSLAPLFVYLVLKDQPKGKHLTQKEITTLLERDYEVSIGRKALSRILHSLDEAGVGIVSTSNDGTWLEAA